MKLAFTRHIPASLGMQSGFPYREEAEAQHVVDTEGFELQYDGGQISALHLWHSRGWQLLIVLLC